MPGCQLELYQTTKKVLLMKPIRRYGVIDDGRGFVTKALASSQQPVAELAVFTLLRMPAARFRPQVGPKTAILFEYAPLECHVGTKRCVFERPSFEIRSKHCEWCEVVCILKGDRARR